MESHRPSRESLRTRLRRSSRRRCRSLIEPSGASSPASFRGVATAISLRPMTRSRRIPHPLMSRVRATKVATESLTARPDQGSTEDVVNAADTLRSESPARRSTSSLSSVRPAFAQCTPRQDQRDRQSMLSAAADTLPRVVCEGAPLTAGGATIAESRLDSSRSSFSLTH